MDNDPRKATTALTDRFPTSGFRMVSAVGACPKKADWVVGMHSFRIDLKHVFAVMLCVRVVCGVHGDRFTVVVDGYMHRVPDSLFNSGARSAASGKTVYDQFRAKSELFHIVVFSFVPFVRAGSHLRSAASFPRPWFWRRGRPAFP
jgi:hypothetical protein